LKDNLQEFGEKTHNHCSSTQLLFIYLAVTLPPSNLATASDDIPDKKRKGKKIHTHTHTKFKRERKKNTLTHSHNSLHRWEGRKEGKWVLPFTSLCQSEPAAHQCTMKVIRKQFLC
jgi:hypothetical protein